MLLFFQFVVYFGSDAITHSTRLLIAVRSRLCCSLSLVLAPLAHRRTPTAEERRIFLSSLPFLVKRYQSCRCVRRVTALLLFIGLALVMPVPVASRPYFSFRFVSVSHVFSTARETQPMVCPLTIRTPICPILTEHRALPYREPRVCRSKYRNTSRSLYSRSVARDARTKL